MPLQRFLLHTSIYHTSQSQVLPKAMFDWFTRFFLGVVLIIFVILAVFIPLSGALVRWRVHYTPRRIQLVDTEDEQNSGACPAPVLISILLSMGILSAAESHLRFRWILQHVAKDICRGGASQTRFLVRLWSHSREREFQVIIKG